MSLLFYYLIIAKPNVNIDITIITAINITTIFCIFLLLIARSLLFFLKNILSDIIYLTSTRVFRKIYVQLCYTTKKELGDAWITSIILVLRSRI